MKDQKDCDEKVQFYWVYGSPLTEEQKLRYDTHHCPIHGMEVLDELPESCPLNYHDPHAMVSAWIMTTKWFKIDDPVGPQLALRASICHACLAKGPASTPRAAALHLAKFAEQDEALSEETTAGR